MAESSPLHRHEEWKAETAELHQLLATAQQRLSISPRSASGYEGAATATPQRAQSPGSMELSAASALEPPAVQPSLASRLPESRLPAPPPSTLLEDMRSALQLPELCDAIMVAKNGEEVRGIRAVLACRSAHFRKLLQDASPSDGAPTVLQMPEVTHAALTAVVAYLVTDELGVTAPGDGGGSEWAVWVELVSLGEGWSLPSLEHLARLRIAQALDESNVVEILVEATHFGLEQLKKDCIAYIVSHKESVRQKRSWQELTAHPDILLEISLAL